MSDFEHPWAALEHMAAAHGGEEALAFPHSGQRLSFAAWRERALRLAAGLVRIGLGSGDHLALLAENRIEWPIVQLAAAALGALLVPLNTHYRRADLADSLRESDSRAVILSERFRSNPYLEHVLALRGGLPKLEHVICLDRVARTGAIPLEDLIDPAPPGIRPQPREPGLAAALLFTSGTTGTPKGALLTHRGMMRNARETAARLYVRRGDRWTSIIPLFHCAGCIMNLLGCLQNAAAYVGVPAFDPEGMFAVIERERCTLLSGVPTSYLAMLLHPARGRYDLGSLRAGTCGGADCNAEVLRRCSEEFPLPGLCQVYGQTEGSTLLSCPDARDPERFATAGPPLPGFALRIADPESGANLPAGATGEIQGRGAMVMLGYHGRPEATAETVTAEGWLRTGDLGYLTPEGRLVIAGGRLRDMIIRGGENVYPAEIEDLLLRHPAVAQVAVFGLPDGYYDEIVAAAVRPRAECAAADLAAFCGERIAGFKVPARFFRVESFPMTQSGKIRKVELRALGQAGRLEALP